MNHHHSRTHAVLFTMAVSAVSAALLTLAHTRWKAQVARNEAFARQRAIVQVLGLAPDTADRAAIEGIFREDVTRVRRGAMDIYEGRRDGRPTGSAFEVAGRGQHGPINGILAVSPDKQRVLGLRIYRHSETPGLGGRIASPAWLAQFAGKPVRTHGLPGLVFGSPEDGPHVIDGITGASITTDAAGRMINRGLSRFLSGGKPLLELDLGLAPDAVTRATPGYPRSLPKPRHLRKELRRPAFLTVPGLVNLALEKPATSSTAEPIIGELAQIVDGVRRSGDFDYVELEAGLQWIQVDLGRPASIHAVVLWHYYRNPVIYRDVVVQVADDEDFTQNVRTLFNNDHDNSSGLGRGDDTAYYARWWGEIVDSRGEEHEGTHGRFVRVYTSGGSAGEETRFVEVAVFGKVMDP